MSAKPTKRKSSALVRVSKRATGLNYHAWSGGIASLLEEARRQYKLALPDPRLIEKEIEKTRRMLELRPKRSLGIIRLMRTSGGLHQYNLN